VLTDMGEREVDRDRLREVVEEDLMRDKIFDWLEANNTIELVPEGSLTPEPNEELRSASVGVESEVSDQAASDQTVTVEAVSVAVDESAAEPEESSDAAIDDQLVDSSDSDEGSKPSSQKLTTGNPAKIDAGESEEGV